MRLFFQVIFPLLQAGDRHRRSWCSRSSCSTTSRTRSTSCPGDENATVQLTLFNFQSQFNTSYNLLFTNILLITIPPLIMYIFFNRQIVAGMTAGAVKG